MISRNAPEIEVGIMKAEKIRFRLDGKFQLKQNGFLLEGEAEAELVKGDISIRSKQEQSNFKESLILEPLDGEHARFSLQDVVIGIGFHWEQKEEQEFQGALKMMIAENEIQVVNVISLEDYLISVISSEMRGDSSPDLLKAHTIISRSWLMAQIEKQDVLADSGEAYKLEHSTEEEYIRWYDREDHDLFHVCADDHCQRYQGTTRSHNPEVVKAVTETAGEILAFEGRICDARFSKCCGGVVEEFQHCWEPVHHPYLKRVEDNPASASIHSGDLKIESNAVDFIKGSPEAFCNTTESGESGRLVKLKIVGSKQSLIVGKELEIRRWLSTTHLYSSAFIVEKLDIKNGVPGSFLLRGAGWGHGVGLCQIGAAVMASKGYKHTEILKHYFIDASIEKRYE